MVPAQSQRGQRLARLEDLLGDDPGPAGERGQVAQVAAGVGQPVRVVDAQSVDHAVGDQLADQLVRGVEDVRQSSTRTAMSDVTSKKRR